MKKPQEKIQLQDSLTDDNTVFRRCVKWPGLYMLLSVPNKKTDKEIKYAMNYNACHFIKNLGVVLC